MVAGSGAVRLIMILGAITVVAACATPSEQQLDQPAVIAGTKLDKAPNNKVCVKAGTANSRIPKVECRRVDHVSNRTLVACPRSQIRYCQQ